MSEQTAGNDYVVREAPWKIKDKPQDTLLQRLCGTKNAVLAIEISAALGMADQAWPEVVQALEATAAKGAKGVTIGPYTGTNRGVMMAWALIERLRLEGIKARLVFPGGGCGIEVAL